MSSIDERIVGMKFDNAQFEKGVSTTSESLSKLEKSLNLKGATKGLSSVASAAGKLSLDGVLRAADTVNQRLSGLGIMGVAALTRIANAAIDAGSKLAKSLTIEPIMQGFGEYELKMGSIQTILANTARHGTGLSQVTKSLDDLNAYADKTIYNFGDMTKNIGLFTNAGIKVEDATAMIKGFSNEAAASGTTAQGASGAAYQLSQALSAGTIRLMDWRSLTNVGMGNKNMQQGIIEIADAMGTFKGKSMSAETAAKDFNGSLEKGWLTADVMQNYLKIQAGELSDAQMKSLGLNAKQIEAFKKQQKTAEEAATKVRTWTQLVDTMQEAVGSGWAQTFDILIGDFDQATELFTHINDTVGPFIDGMSDARNQLLQGWADLGGRTKLLEAFGSVFKGLGQIAAPIAQAFRETFKAITPKDLMGATEAFKAFADRLRVTSDQADKIKRAFKGVFAIFSIVGQAIKAVIGTIAGMLGVIAPAGSGFLSFAADIGDWLVNLDAAIKKGDIFAKVGQKIVAGFSAAVAKIQEFGGKLSDFATKVKDSLKKFSGLDLDGVAKFTESLKEKLKPMESAGGVFKKLGDKIVDAWGVIGPALSKFGGKIGEFAGKIKDEFAKLIENFDLGKALAIFNGGLLSVVLVKVIGFFKGLKKTASEDSGTIKSAFKDLIGGLTDTLGQMQNTLKAGTLLLIAAAIGLLAISAVQLSQVDAGGLAKALGAITIMVGQLFAMMAGFNKIMSAGGLKGMVTAGVGLIVFAAAIAILSSSVIRLSEVPFMDLLKGLGAVTVLLAGLTGVAAVLSKSSGSFMKGALGLIPFAIAIRLLADSVIKLGGIDMGTLAKGLGSVVILLGGLAAFFSNPKLGSAGVKTGMSMLLLGAGLLVISQAVKQLAGIELGELAKGVGAISILIAVLGGFTAVAGGAKGMVGIGIGMVLLGSAMLILSNALASMGALPLTTIGKGLLAMGGSLLIIAVAMKFMTTAIPGALALLIIAPALLILGDALEKLGGFSMEEIGKSLLMLAGSLLVIAGAMYLMTGALPGAAALLVVAAALTILVPVLQAFAAMSLGEIGMSLLTLVAVMGAFAIGGLLIAPVIPILLGLGAALLLMGAAVILAGVGVAALASGLVILAGTGAAGAAALTMALQVMIGQIPFFLEQLAIGFMTFMAVLADSFTSIVDFLVVILQAVIAAIVEVIPDVVDAAVELAMGLLEGIQEVAPELIDTVVMLIHELLDAIVDLVPALVDAGMRLIIGVIDGIGSNIGQLVEKGTDTVVNFLNGIANAMPRVGEAAVNVVKSFVTTLVDSIIASKSHIESEAMRLLDAMFGGAWKAVKKGVGEVPGKIREFISKIGSALSGGAGEVLSKAESLAGNIIRGMVNGIRNGIGQVTSAARGIARDALNAAKSALGIASPSKEFIKVGEYVRQGFVIGLKSGRKDDIVKAYNTMASGLQSVIDNAKKDAKTATGKLQKLEASYKKLSRSRRRNSKAIKENQKQQAALRKEISELNAEASKASKALAKLKGTNNVGTKDELNKLTALADKHASLTARLKDANAAYQDAVKTRDDYSASLKEQFSAISSIPGKTEYEEYAEAIASGAKGTKTPLKVFTEQLKQQVEDTNLFAAKIQQLRKLGLNDKMYTKLLEAGTDSLPFVSELLKGGAGAVRDVNTLSKDLDLAAGKLGTSAARSMYQAGVNAAKGLVDGLNKQIAEVGKVAKRLADQIVASIKKSLQIKSPSRVLAQLGNYTGQGFVAGLTSTIGTAEKAAEEVTSATVDSMRQAIAEAKSLLSEDFGESPTITPVIDLSEVRRGANSIKGMLGGVVSATNDYQRAASLYRDIPSSSTTAASAEAADKGGVTYNQYNMSPKALSEADIYRQTKNQLSTIKRSLEV